MKDEATDTAGGSRRYKAASESTHSTGFCAEAASIGASQSRSTRARGYEPEFDKLPWKDEYDAKKSSERL